MATIVTRAGKGSPLTNTEVDSNFTNLNTNKQEVLAEGSFADGDKTKLDGIESGADVTDTANVTAAGALMDSELTNITAVKALNQGVATTDEPSWDGVNLNAISASISDTAVDVFVYDTRKDSDGGAWRKRCQHTSWYNETLNTATRGSRKEFPAVAVIVAEAAQITIYDGDDPDMPMWMVFNPVASKNTLLGYSTAFNSLAIVAGNGAIFVASNSGSTYTGGYQQVNFLTEVLFRMRADVKRQSIFNIAQRNDGFSDSEAIETSTQVIVSGLANDVAMTVLPNAPIDDATGLPIPTIAVATDGGVSVIKDDGSVVDLVNSNSSYTRAGFVAFNETNGLVFPLDYYASDAERFYYVVDNIPSSDFVVTSTTATKGSADKFYTAGTDYQPDLFTLGDTSTPAYSANGSSIAGYNGLTLIDENTTTPSEGMVNYITSSYNTGWMNGDIKLATLSDTDDADVTGSELVTNGTFDTDYSDWTLGSGTTATVVSGEVEVTAGSVYGIYQELSGCVVGKTYTLSAVGRVASTGDVRLRIYPDTFNAGSSTDSNSVTATTNQSMSLTFTAESTSPVVYLRCSGNGIVGYFDNVSVRLAEEDRSVNGNGLQVFGTVTKNPVATGADLVAYSGFANNANYLKQPNNSDLAFNSDFCFMLWVKDNVTAGDYYFQYANTTGNYAYSMSASSQVLSFQTNNGVSVTGTWGTRGSNIWTHIAVVHKNNVAYLYLNGELVNSDNASGSPTYVGDEELYVGIASNLSSSAGGASLALLRASATAPSAEQILKIYNDEKYLFQENAKATLTGSSDAVTALAYDDDTNILSVGTSGGRSDFSGLRRVNETATAVTTAISASNELIVEQ